MPRQYALVFACVLFASPGLAQDTGLVECNHRAFFGPSCPPPIEPSPRGETDLPTLPPLFPPETMARDTPPLLLALLNNPTPEAARLYLQWQHERQARMEIVQQILANLIPKKGTP